MKLILSFFILAATYSMNAQTKEELISTWVFKSIDHKNKLNEEEIKKIDQKYSDIVFYMRKNDKYMMSGFDKLEEGTWTLENNILILTPSSGKTSKLEIIELKGNLLVIKIHKETVIMVKEGTQ